jgi:sugar/nucleoside kinase (ribokinase family)
MNKRKGTNHLGKSSRTNGSGTLDALARRSRSATAVGTGFVALDIVIADGQEKNPRMWAGGTCGNVMAILAYLGWRTYPVAALGRDTAADWIIEDLTRFGVDARFIQRDSERRTPIVIERIRSLANGSPRSRFVWTCPGCGAWLPGFQPVLAKRMESVVADMPDAAVFFFDRVSRGALDLAKAAAKRGALVVFEPSGVRDERLFREALAVTHVLKYSHERLSGIAERLGEGSPALEVETLGAEGLRYRVRGRSRSHSWCLVDAYGISEVRDTVGAGDWCTAGLIHALGPKGAAGLANANEAEVERALRLGQALAAFTCAYEGARGGMYAVHRRQFRATIKRILDGGSPGSHVERPDAALKELWEAVCPACGPESRKRPYARRVG